MKHTILNGDVIGCLKTLSDGAVQCVVTSPPYYGLRDYGHDKQIGLEETPEAYVNKLVDVFREVRRVLRDDGTVWLNLGDSYNGGGKGQCVDGENDPKKNKTRGMKRSKSEIVGLKPKDLTGIPWRVAFALQADGWYLRQDIIWHKLNPMPESVTDRCTKAHEYIFLLTKSAKYFYDNEAVKEPVAETTVKRAKSSNNATSRKDGGDAKWQGGLTPEQQNKYYKDINGSSSRNRRSVWTISTRPYEEAHFATFPRELVEPCIKAGSAPGDTVMDIFGGSGTVAEVARDLDRSSISIELNPDYVKLIRKRLKMDQQLDTGIYEYETRVIS